MENTLDNKNRQRQKRSGHANPHRARHGRRPPTTTGGHEQANDQPRSSDDQCPSIQQGLRMPERENCSLYLVGIEKDMRDLSIENIGARAPLANSNAKHTTNRRGQAFSGPRPPRQMDAESWRRAPDAPPLFTPKNAPPFRGRRQEHVRKYIHNDDVVRDNRRTLFSPFMSLGEMHQQLKEEKLYEGVLRINRRNRNDGYVTSDDLEQDIYIFGQRDRNRALEGDVVAVRLLDVEKIYHLKKEKEKKRRVERAEREGRALVEEDEDGDDDEEDAAKPKYCGEIVGILDREKSLRYSGTISIQRPNGNMRPDNDSDVNKSKVRSVWFRPTDKRVPFLCISLGDAPPDIVENFEHYKDKVMEAEVKRWNITSLYPFGKIVGEIGNTGDLEVQAQANLVDNNIPTTEFDKLVYVDLPSVPWSIPAKEFAKRRDLRQERIFTIDPATAKDLDDALHIKHLPDGFLEVGVHIADVSFFVNYDSVLDTEARKRGTSTYLVDKVVPMLPPLLCEELCSLNPGVDRLAFSVIWKMDKSGNVVDTWFGRTIIRSCAKLAYDDAQNVIEEKGLPASAIIHDNANAADIEDCIKSLFQLSRCMRQRRFENGALSMNSVKLCFKLDKNGEPVDVCAFESKEANKLIEEFMLRANISVAEKLCKHFPDDALLRRHPYPITRRLNEFIKMTEGLGYEFDGSSAGSLQMSFDRLDHPEIKELLLILAIKPMQRAKYFCSGTLDISKYEHYALNERVYTHFTSPIRRYADLVVHRQLETALKNEDGHMEKTKVQQIALHCNRRKDAAKNAQEANIMVYLSRYLHNLERAQGPIYDEAIVFAVHSEALEIYVPRYGLEKRIHVDSLPLTKFEFDKHRQSLSLFWKQDVQVSTHVEEALYAKERERRDDFDDDDHLDEDGIEDGQTSATLNEESDANDSQPGKRIVLIPEQMIQERYMEEDKCMQRFQMFTKLDIRIQVNVNQTVSFINVYPVNPFAPLAK